MQQKLYKSNTPCNPELVTERSLSAASHYTSNYVTSSSEAYREVNISIINEHH